MKLVIIESPLGTKPDGTRCTAEEMAENQRYADACMADSLRRREAPFGSHIIYPRVLNDATPEERKLGMEAGFAWGVALALVNAGREMSGDQPLRQLGVPLPECLVAVYVDRGITSGMDEGIRRHLSNGLRIEERRLGGEWAQ